MDPPGGRYLDRRAACSPIGAARLSQLVLGCAVVAMVIHSAGYSGSYGVFCMAVWCLCFAVTTVIFFLDATRLYGCLPVSWGNLTVAFAALATLMYVTASVVYPLYFVSSECPYAGCEVRNFRIAVATCSMAATLAYGAEVVLSRRPGQAAAAGYMATPPGVLKVVQAFVACVIFGGVANGGGLAGRPGLVCCVAVWAGCFGLTSLLVLLAVCGRTGALRCLPWDRLLGAYGLLALLLYLSASVAWPVLCFDSKYGSPWRPASCPRGGCVWDSQLVVSVLSFLNLGLYAADLLYSQRPPPGPRAPRAPRPRV
ncbi:unnamed protein product [Gadus morhua 'NCC']